MSKENNTWVIRMNVSEELYEAIKAKYENFGKQFSDGLKKDLYKQFGVAEPKPLTPAERKRLDQIKSYEADGLTEELATAVVDKKMSLIEAVGKMTQGESKPANPNAPKPNQQKR